MSALPPKADINGCIFDVRFVPKAEVAVIGETVAYCASPDSDAHSAPKQVGDSPPQRTALP